MHVRRPAHIGQDRIDDAVDVLADQQAVRHRQHGWAVDDDEVVLLFELFKERANIVLGQRLQCVRVAVARGEYPQSAKARGSCRIGRFHMAIARGVAAASVSIWSGRSLIVRSD